MNDLENGVRAFKEGDYQTALSLLKPLAERGNSSSSVHFGNMYHLGLGIEKDGSEAIAWYLKSAKQGYAIASNNLAGIYSIGDCGVVANREKAMEWYEMSREQGFSQTPLKSEPEIE